jgi:hypothetical protein
LLSQSPISTCCYFSQSEATPCCHCLPSRPVATSPNLGPLLVATVSNLHQLLLLSIRGHCLLPQSPLSTSWYFSQSGATSCCHCLQYPPFASSPSQGPLLGATVSNLHLLLLLPIRDHSMLPLFSISTCCYFSQSEATSCYHCAQSPPLATSPNQRPLLVATVSDLHLLLLPPSEATPCCHSPQSPPVATSPNQRPLLVATVSHLDLLLLLPI